MIQPNQPAGSAASVFAVIGVMAGCALLGWIVVDTSGILNSKPAPGGHHPEIVNLTEASWQKEVVDSKIPVVVDFWAPWCKPCLDFSPTIDKLAVTYAGRVKIAKLNVDDAGAIAAEYGVRNIPRVLIFKGGAQPRRSILGLVTEAELTKEIDGVLSDR